MAGMRDRGPRFDAPPPAAPPSCGAGMTGCFERPDLWKAPQQSAPIRECPTDSSMVTVRPGVRYCIPDRPIHD
jgi:hypothetical protein